MRQQPSDHPDVEFARWPPPRLRRRRCAAPEGALFATWGGSAPRFRPHACGDAAALPPSSSQLPFGASLLERAASSASSASDAIGELAQPPRLRGNLLPLRGAAARETRSYRRRRRGSSRTPASPPKSPSRRRSRDARRSSPRRRSGSRGRCACDPAMPTQPAIAVCAPIRQLWPIWIWLSSLTSSSITVSSIAPRSIVVLAPISHVGADDDAADLRNLVPAAAFLARARSHRRRSRRPLWTSVRAPTTQRG